jgi:hypothetical protein
MIPLKAISIGYRVLELFISRTNGIIHSVNKNSFYCLFPNKEILLVYEKKYGRIPFGISINQSFKNYFCELGLRKDMDVKLGEYYLYIPEGNIFLELQGGKVWVSRIENNHIFSVSKVMSNLDYATELCLLNGSMDGLGKLLSYQEHLICDRTISEAGLNSFCRFSIIPIMNLMAAIERNDSYLLERSLKKLIGLGVGLTPSSDDMLIGLFTTLYFFHRHIKLNYISSLAKALYFLSIGKTTLISEIFLKFISQGERFEILDDAIMAVLSTSKPNLYVRINKVLSIGSSSGTEMILGILLGIRLILKILEAPVYKS